MARKNGYPMSARNWTIDILGRASTDEAPVWLRVRGINEMALTIESDTEDGSSAESAWSENYKTKLNGSLKLEGKPVIEAITGAQDPGQAELDYYLNQTGFSGDARLRLADPYGRMQIIDVIVTDRENEADDTSEVITWEMDIVGEPIELPYVQVTGVSVSPGAASVGIGQAANLTVAIAPQDASNQKYSVASADTSKVRVTNVDGLNFAVTGVALTSGAVPVVVKTMNGAHSASVDITVA